MKKYDFLILYDGKQRELESVCLLGYELKRRGYSVKIFPQSTWYYLTNRIPTFHCEVLIAPWGYNDDTLIFALRHVGRLNKYVSLQWEQFWDLADDTNPQHFGFISGWAKKCVHLSWGPKNANKLIDQCGIEERNIIKAGHPAYDFLRGEFGRFYMEKQELFSRYELPLDKTVLLFISSFYFSSLPDNLVPGGDFYTTNEKNIIIETSIKVKDMVLDMFSRLLDRHKDIVIIYRLHPVEWGCEKVMNMTKKHPNFRLISELSVKQWIKAADKVYLWQSSSMAEAVISGKPCYSIGTNDMEHGMRSPLLEHSKYIDNYEEFEASVFCKEVSSNVDQDAMKERYGYTTSETPTYRKICDRLEEVYKDSSYCLPQEAQRSLRGIKTARDQRRLAIKKSRIYDVVFYLAQKTNLPFQILQRVRKQIAPFQTDYYRDIQKRGLVSPGEIDGLVKKIAAVLEKGEK